MKDNNKIIGIIALSALKGIGPAFVKKVVSNSTFENTNLIQEIKEIITSAGRIALDVRERGLAIKTKEDNSPVTNADIQISDYIFTKLLEIMPSIPVVCEERTLVDITDKKQFWLIDPIDGTRSFIKNNR